MRKWERKNNYQWVFSNGWEMCGVGGSARQDRRDRQKLSKEKKRTVPSMYKWKFPFSSFICHLPQIPSTACTRNFTFCIKPAKTLHSPPTHQHLLSHLSAPSPHSLSLLAHLLPHFRLEWTLSISLSSVPHSSRACHWFRSLVGHYSSCCLSVHILPLWRCFSLALTWNWGMLLGRAHRTLTHSSLHLHCCL